MLNTSKYSETTSDTQIPPFPSDEHREAQAELDEYKCKTQMQR